MPFRKQGELRMLRPIGTLAGELVAKRVLTTVRERWKLILLSQDKQIEIRWSEPLAQIATVNYVSGTYAIIQLNRRTHEIESVTVRWIENEQPCEDGHWRHVHTLLARIGREKIPK